MDEGVFGAARRLSLSPYHAAAVSDARILRIFGELSSAAAAHPLLLGLFQFSICLSAAAGGRCFMFRGGHYLDVWTVLVVGDASGK